METGKVKNPQTRKSEEPTANDHYRPSQKSDQNNETEKNQLPTKNHEIRERDNINTDVNTFKQQMVEQFNSMKKSFLAEVNIFKDDLSSFRDPPNTNNKIDNTNHMSDRLRKALQDQASTLKGNSQDVLLSKIIVPPDSS